MAKRTSITAIYQADEHERYAVTVKVGSGYPDALDEARAQAVRGVRELVVSAIVASEVDE